MLSTIVVLIDLFLESQVLVHILVNKEKNERERERERERESKERKAATLRLTQGHHVCIIVFYFANSEDQRAG
jgi:predicted amino acid dehydrogenase